MGYLVYGVPNRLLKTCGERSIHQEEVFGDGEDGGSGDEKEEMKEWPD
jgi:hypothetical protein